VKRIILLLVLIAVLLVVFPRVIQPWYEDRDFLFYSMPLHSDEWQHYSISQSLNDNVFDATMVSYEGNPDFVDTSPLFHWIIFLFQKIGLTPSLFFILPLLQIIAFASIFFLLIKELLGRNIATISTILALFIRSDAHLLGLLFFKPFTFGLVLLFLGIFLVHKRGLSWEYFITLAALIFIYPPYILLSLIYMVAYTLFIKKTGIRSKRIIGVIGVSGIISIAFGLYLAGGSAIDLLNKVIYPLNWTSAIQIDLLSYLGIALIVFGIIGLAKTFNKRELFPLHFVFLFFLFDFVALFATGYSFGFHYLRIIYIGAILFAVYAGVGIDAVARRVFKNKMAFQKIGAGVLVLSVVLPTILFYINFNDQHYPKIYITPKHVSTPLSGFKATAMPEGFIYGKRDSYFDFLSDTCPEKEQFLTQENYQIIFSETDISCAFLTTLFDNDVIRIYTYY